MSYVPIVPHVPPPEPSPRARRLAVELEETIERFEREQGRLDGDEVEQALGIVQQATVGSGSGTSVATSLVLGLAVLLGGLVLVLALGRAGLPVAGRFGMVGGVIALLAVGATVFAVRSGRR